MLPYRDGTITKAALVLFFLLAAGYAYFEAQGLLFGPAIRVTSDITEVHDPFIVIKGHADRIASLSMNGKPISVTESGDFSEPYVLAEGDNRIVLDASDKYGRSRRNVIDIVYTSLATTSPDTSVATSTASTSPMAQ
jgi:hypothetical protein